MQDREILVAATDRDYENILIFRRVNTQLWMVVEEMSELMKAICQYDRHRCPAFYKELAEEIVDVEMMLDQLKIIFGFDNEYLSQIRKVKIERLKQRLEEVK